MNLNSSLWTDVAQQSPQITQFERDAAGGRRTARARHVDENRTAAPCYAGPRVVIDLDNNVVESVIAPQPISWFIGRPTKEAIVASVGWILAPGIGAANGADRKQCPRSRQTVGSPPQPHRPECAPWGTAIAFPLIRLDAGTAEGHRDQQVTRAQPTFGRPSRLGADANRGEGCSFHARRKLGPFGSSPGPSPPANDQVEFPNSRLLFYP